MKKRVMLILSCLFLSIGFILAQTTTISGTVVDNNGESVIGASVVVKGTTIGVATDLDGKFTIEVPDGKNTLVFSLVGMNTIEQTARQGMKVVMNDKETALDEVMVVAYGTAKKESFTGSASVVDNKKIEKRLVSNVTKAIDGLVSGVQTTSGGGQPGNESKIIIRGFGSISASNNPLYIVDGIPYDGTLSSLNSHDIQSMTVLKDASAAALYGSRAANGVVIITTKRGEEGATKVNFKANIGWVTRGIPNYDLVNQKEFVQLNYESFRNAHAFTDGESWSNAESLGRGDLAGKLGGEQYNPFKNYTWNTIINPETGLVQADAQSVWNESWMDAIEQTGLRQDYQVTIRGGSAKTKSMLSFGYLGEEGVLKTTKFERFSGRANIDYEAKHWLNTGMGVNFSSSRSNYSTYDGTSNANPWYTAQFMSPIYPVYVKDLDGSNLLDENGKKQLDYGVNRPKLNNFSSIGTLYDDISNTKNDNLSTRLAVTLGSDNESMGWMKGLKFSVNLGADYRTLNQKNYYNMMHGNFASAGGMLYKYNTRMLSYTFNQLLTYNKKIGDHSFDFLAGHEAYKYKYDYQLSAKSGLVPGIIEMAPGSTLKGASTYQHNHRIESYLGRANYNYADRYYFSASLRTDGSSRFHKDNRWGTFWSVGGNWRVSEENFMKNISWVDNLSVKASYGLQGNEGLYDPNEDVDDEISDYYAWMGRYDFTWPNANQSGAVAYMLENKDITWEKNYNLNIGFDARLFNRLDISFEYYNRKSKDLLLYEPKALSTGYAGFFNNVGDMTNQGFEIGLGATIINLPNFTWRTNILASTTKNKIEKLSSRVPRITRGAQVIEEGKEIYTFYVSKTAGVDPATGAQLYWVYDLDEDGNKINERISSDATKATNSKYYLGSRAPDLFGSFGMDFTFFKNFDLSFTTAYSIGGKIYDSKYAALMTPTYDGDTWSKHALRRWQKPGDITDVPRATLGGSSVTSDRYLIDASYLALRNITFGYTIPKNILSKIGCESVRFSVTADNLFTLTKLKGMDPQYSFRGTTDYSYMPNKTVSFGIDINF